MISAGRILFVCAVAACGARRPASQAADPVGLDGAGAQPGDGAQPGNGATGEGGPRMDAASGGPNAGGPYPRSTPLDPCSGRIDVAMACWDRGVDKKLACQRVSNDTRASLVAKGTSTACVDNLLESCMLGCGLAQGGNETREHFYALMTSPPP